MNGFLEIFIALGTVAIILLVVAAINHAVSAVLSDVVRYLWERISRFGKNFKADPNSNGGRNGLGLLRNEARMNITFSKRSGRRQLRAQPFPANWRSIVARNMPIFRRLPRADQAELLGHIQVFLDEKYFEGCGGLEVTDDIRVTIAAQACLLLLHRQTDYYPRLVTILVYPSAYIAREDRYLGDNIWEQGDDARLGHTGSRMGSLVLAWDEARRGAADPADGTNLVLHEFAHQLDFEDSQTDGAPCLSTRRESLAWARVMRREFETLRRADEAGTPTILDKYGTTNPAEFFAVATEAFFERPRALRAKQPEIYAQLAGFYRQDPARYSAEPSPHEKNGNEPNFVAGLMPSVDEEKISVLAPIGAAMLGYRVGDEFEGNVPQAMRRMKVAKVDYKPLATAIFRLAR
jgi:MtfA peptidase